MKMADIRDMSGEQLQEQLIALRKEQFGLRMQSASGQLGQSHLLQEARRNIARIKTVMTQRADDAAAQQTVESNNV